MRVLIAEDDAISRRVLQAMLRKWDYETAVACDGNEAWSQLQQPQGPRLVILDWMMPGLDGLEICRRIRRQQQDNYTYVILLTARGQRENIIQGMNAGADDYITKPFDAGELKVRLGAARRILELQDKLLAVHEALREQATHDSLTGLLNRPAVLEACRRELDRANREQKQVGVILADLDHFKRINDKYGHDTGDAVLREAANRMSEVIRAYDSLGRYGGEEFLLIAPNCDARAGKELADRLRRRIADSPLAVCGKEVTLTISLGVTAYLGQQHPDANELVRQADATLYEAKALGRDCVAVHKQADRGADEPVPTHSGG